MDAPELAQAPYGEQAVQLSGRAGLKIGSKVHTSFSGPWIAWPHLAEVIGEVQLEPGAMVEDGWPLRT